MLDRASGAIVGSANMAQTTDTVSMIKAWLASDFCVVPRRTARDLPRTGSRIWR